MDNEETYYTIAEFAKRLRVHPNTIRRAINCGRLQAFRIGQGKKASYRICKSEIMRICEIDLTKVIERMIEEREKKSEG